MFAHSPKALAALAVIATPALVTPALANDAAPSPTIPVTVDLSEVEALPGTLYVSIQMESDYMTDAGFGGVLKPVAGMPEKVTYEVDMPGTYAVSLWHDLDDDQNFSMNLVTGEIADGWGASGNVSESKRPTFADVAVDVPSYGGEVKVRMFYPE